jgi:hypothetical protein
MDTFLCPVCNSSYTTTAVCGNCASDIDKIDHSKLPDPDLRLTPSAALDLKNLIVQNQRAQESTVQGNGSIIASVNVVTKDEPELALPKPFVVPGYTPGLPSE